MTVRDIRTTIGRFSRFEEKLFRGDGGCGVWKLVHRVLSRSVAAPWRWGSSGSGISNLLPGMYRLLKNGHRIGYIGDFTESCCHGPSKLRQAFPIGVSNE